MYSDQYNYYNIQFDENFGQELNKSDVVQILLDSMLFKQTNHQSFTNSENFPWVDLVLVETYDGNFVSSEIENKFVTLIAITCSKGNEVDQMIYINEFKKIANTLKWKLFLEEDDFENYNIQL